MSTRHLLNLTMGAFATLLLAAVGVVFSTTGDHAQQSAQIDLAVRQQVLIQDLTRQTAVLADATDRTAVETARENLAHTIVQFDRNLAALLHGGSAVDANGQTIVIERTQNDMARLALQDGAQLWLETGLPLSDLTAGEFSIFSAAGQKAIKGLQNNNVELMQNMGTVANALRMNIHARGTVGNLARWAAFGLGGILIAFGVFRPKLLATEPPLTPPSRQPEAPVPSTQAAPAATLATAPAPPPAIAQPGVFTSPVNFDTVGASVNQMSVDMNTIAGSTDKMRLAIDSVGNALQGMLYSLQEMAQDTAEGHKIVRSANNAASFTADTAGDLAASAREMAAVVAQVTQLAQKTKQIAAQIDGEAVHTGKTGAAFTSVVAGEVKGLAQQTSGATREIEETVAGILLTTRQYEEAIGQIIKNVSAINKVSENLGQLMMAPPQRVEPGSPLPTAQVLAPAVPVTPVAPVPPVAAVAPAAPAAPAPAAVAPPAPAPVPTPAPPPVVTPAPVADDPVVVEATPAEVADDTAAAIEEAAETPAAETGSNGNVFMLGGRAKKPSALSIPTTPAPEAEKEPAAEVPAAPEPVAEDSASPDGGSNNNVFMLGGPKKPKKKPAEPQAEPKAETPATPTPTPAPAKEADDDDGGNVFMLNKPKQAPKDAAPEPVAEPTPAPTAPTFTGPNIYGLELAVVTEAAATPPPAAETVLETVPADDSAKDESGSNDNIFMLNKPK